MDNVKIKLEKRGLKERDHEKRILLCLFVLDGLDSLPEIHGRQIDQEIIDMVRDLIIRQFESVGGYVSCKNRESFVVRLPDSDSEGASYIIEGLKRVIHRRGMEIMDECSRVVPVARFSWSISMALVECRPRDDINSALVSLRSETVTIARFSLESRR